MSQFVEAPTKTFTTGGAVTQYARLSYSSSVVTNAGADAPGVGTAEVDAASGEPVAVRLWTAEGTRKMIANAAISSGAPVYAAASGKVGASGNLYVGRALEAASADGDVIEVLTGVPDLGAARVLRARFTAAQVNAGATILTALPGLKYRVHDISLIAEGGNAATATSVDVLGTQSASSVKLMDGRVAGLTQNTLLRAGTATNGLILAAGASFAPCDANTAITIGKTGSDLATATHIHVLLTYDIEA
jgi:hypothetical protein